MPSEPRQGKRKAKRPAGQREKNNTRTGLPIVNNIWILKSKPPAKLVVCTSPRRAYYLLTSKVALTVCLLHYTHCNHQTDNLSFWGEIIFRRRIFAFELCTGQRFFTHFVRSEWQWLRSMLESKAFSTSIAGGCLYIRQKGTENPYPLLFCLAYSHGCEITLSILNRNY